MARVRDLWVSSRTRQRTARYGSGKRWLAEWAADGQVRTRAFDRRVDAERHLATTVAAVLAGSYVDPAAGRRTLRSYGEAWLTQQVHLRASSAAAYSCHLRVHIYPALGHLPLGSVQRSAVQSLVTCLTRQRLSAGYVVGIYTTLATLLRAAVRDRLVAATPCEGISLPEELTRCAEPFSAEQVFALSAALPARYAVLPELGAGTGLRPGELYGLELDPRRGLDMLRRRVLVRQQLVRRPGAPAFLGPPKTPASVREVPVGAATLEAVAEHLARHPAVEVEILDATGGGRGVRRAARFVVAGGDGAPVPAGFVEHVWAPAVAAAGEQVASQIRLAAAGRELGPEEAAACELPVRPTPHALRHTYASLLIAAGRHPKTIQARLGHRSITTTMDVYGHLFPAEDERTRDDITAALGRGRAEHERNGAAGPAR